MDNTGLSNSGLNGALGKLEEKKLLQREQKKNGKTGKQEVTHYILGFELASQQKPTPISGGGKNGQNSGSQLHQSGDGTDSTFPGGPTPPSSSSRLHHGGVHIDEPVNKPVNEPCADPGADDDLINSKDENLMVSDWCDRFIEIHPRVTDEAATRMAFAAEVEAGADPEKLCRAAKAYGEDQDGNAPRFIKTSHFFLTQKVWRTWASKPTKAQPASPEEVAAFYAEKINSGRKIFGGVIAGKVRQSLIKYGHFTCQKLTELGYPK